jgi:two-component system, OmpR family, copper resistance phosphate regulon response regulator CusR
MRLLIVDDDPKLRSYVCAGLEQSGIEGVAAADGDSALQILHDDTRGFDLILLDVMMPARTGWDLLSDLRERGRETPVIFVTARDSVEERVRGLRLGADDYVIKPFAFQELIARVEVVIRRRKALPPIEVGDLRLDLARRQARRGELAIDLSPREFDLLLALARAEGRVLTRAELLRDVWGIAGEPGTNLVDVHIGRLRRKIDVHTPALIHTVRGEGYRLAVA